VTRYAGERVKRIQRTRKAAEATAVRNGMAHEEMGMLSSAVRRMRGNVTKAPKTCKPPKMKRIQRRGE